MIYVTVQGPANREVFVNGVYGEVAAMIPHTFMLPAGNHKFETLIAGQLVDFRGNCGDLPNGASVTISLAPVSPPQPIT